MKWPENVLYIQWHPLTRMIINSCLGQFKKKLEENSNAGTNDFLSALRCLSPTASANSPTAKTAVGSDTLPRSGYARSDNENQSTALPWSFASSFFYLRRGTAYHACIYFTQTIGALLHAQIYTEKRKSERNWLFTPPLTIYKRTAIPRLPTARNSKTVSFSVADNSVAVLFVYGQGNRVAVAFVLPLAQNLKTV